MVDNNTMKVVHAKEQRTSRRQWSSSWCFYNCCIVLMITLHSCGTCCCCHGQEVPTLFLDKFNYSKNFRSNVCDRQQALWNNTVELPDALRGLTLSVVVTNYAGRPNAPLFALDSLGRIPKRNPGFFAVIMDEVARRAGFHWRNRFGVATPLDPEIDGKDVVWDDVVIWGVESFDISLEKWGYSAQRAAAGVSFPAGFWDSSIVMAEHVPSGSNMEHDTVWFAFLQPFSFTTWIAIIGTIVLTGFQFWYMARWNPIVTAQDAEDAEEQRTLLSAKTNLYLAGIAFTAGDFSFSPHSYADYMLGISFCFAALIIVSTYTANMASFLVTPRYIYFQYPNLDVVVEKEATVCSYGGGVIESLLEKAYPTLDLSLQFSEGKMFSELRPGGSCDVAVHQYNSYRIYERNSEWNNDCSFSTTGDFVVNIPAGMATKVDTTAGKCTSLITYVLDYHLNEMISDGFIEAAFVHHLGLDGESLCRGTVTGNTVKPLDDEEPPRLGLQDVGGIFLFHFVVCIYTLSKARARAFFQRKKKLRTSLLVRNSATAPKLNFNFAEEQIRLNRPPKRKEPKTSEFSESASFVDDDGHHKSEAFSVSSSDELAL